MSRIEPTVQKWTDGQGPRGAAERTLAAGLRLTSWGYGAGIALRNLAYGLGLKRVAPAGVPVVSIGNLSVGGTGKTPLVVETVRRLQANGRRVAVVSRGYGRPDVERCLVVSDGQGHIADAAEAGDEPVLIARRLPEAPVVVGARRAEAARLAVERCGAELIVLDDGFQHRALGRDCDVVLWDTLRHPDATQLLPRGLMREPLSSLRRAHAIVFTRANLGHPTRRLLGRLKRYAPQLTVFHTGLEIAGLREATSPADAPLRPADEVLDGPVAAACGLGNPRSFWRLLEVSGIETVGRTAWPDHHRPSAPELAALLDRAAADGARALLITAKDAENLPADFAPRLPVYVVEARVSWGDDDERYTRFLELRLAIGGG